MHSRLLACTTTAALLTTLAGAALADPGALRQLDATEGCISSDGTGGECAIGNGLAGALDLAISADGASVYVASFSSDAVAALARNISRAAGTIGRLTQAAAPNGCIANGGAPGCLQGKGLLDPFAVAVSRDGASVYVAGAESNAVGVFARDPETGLLRQLDGEDGCVSEDGSNGECTDGSGLDRPVGLAVSRDGRSVYATAGDSTSIAPFAREKRGARRGALTPLACLSETDADCTPQPHLSAVIGVQVSPDGRHLYAVAQGDGAILAFARDPRTGALAPLPGLDGCISHDGSSGTCRQGRGLLGARALATSRDGRSVYVVSEFGNAVAVFARDRRTGALTQLAGLDGCVTEGGSTSTCAGGTALLGPRGVAVSGDGRHVYVAAAGSNAVAVFARNRKTGALAQLPAPAGCVSEDGTGGACRDGKALKSAGGVVVSGDGRSVYVASLGSSAVAVFARERR